MDNCFFESALFWAAVAVCHQLKVVCVGLWARLSRGAPVWCHDIRYVRAYKHISAIGHGWFSSASPSLASSSCERHTESAYHFITTMWNRPQPILCSIPLRCWLWVCFAPWCCRCGSVCLVVVVVAVAAVSVASLIRRRGDAPCTQQRRCWRCHQSIGTAT